MTYKIISLPSNFLTEMHSSLKIWVNENLNRAYFSYRPNILDRQKKAFNKITQDKQELNTNENYHYFLPIIFFAFNLLSSEKILGISCYAKPAYTIFRNNIAWLKCGCAYWLGKSRGAIPLIYEDTSCCFAVSIFFLSSIIILIEICLDQTPSNPKLAWQ